MTQKSKQESEYEGDKQLVVIDLRSVIYIDSSVVTALVKGNAALAGHGLQLMLLLEPGSQPERIYRLGHLFNRIERIETLDELWPGRIVE